MLICLQHMLTQPYPVIPIELLEPENILINIDFLFNKRDIGLVLKYCIRCTYIEMIL